MRTFDGHEVRWHGTTDNSDWGENPDPAHTPWFAVSSIYPGYLKAAYPDLKPEEDGTTREKYNARRYRADVLVQDITASILTSAPGKYPYSWHNSGRWATRWARPAKSPQRAVLKLRFTSGSSILNHRVLSQYTSPWTEQRKVSRFIFSQIPNFVFTPIGQPFGHFPGRGARIIKVSIARTTGSVPQRTATVLKVLIDRKSETWNSSRQVTGFACRFKRSMQHFSSRLTHQSFSEALSLAPYWIRPKQGFFFFELSFADEFRLWNSCT